MAEYVQDGFCYLSIFNTADGTTRSTTGFLRPAGPETQTDYFETAQGRMRVQGRSRRIEVDIVDLDMISTIHLFRENETAVQAVLSGKGRNAQLYTAFIVDSYPVNKGFRSLAAERVVMYTSDINANWTQNVNLMWYNASLSGGTWTTLAGGSPNIPTDWATATTGGITFNDCTFTNNDLAVSVDTPVGASQGRLYLPIPLGVLTGPTLTLSIDFSAVSGNADSIKIFIEERNYSDALLGSTSYTTISGTGRSSVSHILAQSTLYQVYAGVEVNYSLGYTPDAACTFKWPSLRVDGVSEQTRY